MKSINNYSKYDNYKPSYVEWLGDIPTNWDVIPIRFLVKIQTGNTPSKTNPLFYSTSYETPWIKPEELADFFPINHSKESLTELGLKRARLIKKDSILICCIQQFSLLTPPSGGWGAWLQ